MGFDVMSRDELMRVLTESNIEFTCNEWQIVFGNLTFEFDYSGQLEKITEE